MKNIRDATPSDPEPYHDPVYTVETPAPAQNSSIFQLWLKSANALVPHDNTLAKAANVVTKLRSNNFWLALILSIVGFVVAVIFTCCLARRFILPDLKSKEQRQMEWLRTVPKSFKKIYLKT